MSSPPEPREVALRFHAAIQRWLRPAVTALASGDEEEVLAAAGDHFEAMLPELPYVEQPRHSMYPSMLACAAMLAAYRVLRERGADAHAWGRACHALPPAVEDGGEAGRERARRDADASQQGAARNEFVFEIVEENERGERGMNVTSCAICHLFGKYDAMDLVPYMCAYDDVVSDAGRQGLRRTGTIALGASHCDFRFRDGGEPLRLAEQFPDRIRLGDAR